MVEEKGAKPEKGKIESGKEVGDVYFKKMRKIRYLRSKNYKKNCCQICGKRRKTTAHHIIPKRLRCLCPLLSEIRVRVCSECDENFHPENKFLKESEIVQRQNKNINNLRGAVNWRSNKISILEKGLECIRGEGEINSIRKKVMELLDLNDEDFYPLKDKKKRIDKKNKKERYSTGTFLNIKKEVSKK